MSHFLYDINQIAAHLMAANGAKTTINLVADKMASNNHRFTVKIESSNKHTHREREGEREREQHIWSHIFH